MEKLEALVELHEKGAAPVSPGLWAGVATIKKADARQRLVARHAE
jgi:hypothetical protein